MTEAYQEGSGITDKIDYNRNDLVKALGQRTTRTIRWKYYVEGCKFEISMENF